MFVLNLKEQNWLKFLYDIFYFVFYIEIEYDFSYQNERKKQTDLHNAKICFKTIFTIIHTF